MLLSNSCPHPNANPQNILDFETLYYPVTRLMSTESLIPYQGILGCVGVRFWEGYYHIDLFWLF